MEFYSPKMVEIISLLVYNIIKGGEKMFSYKPLWKTLIDKNIKKSKMYSDLKIGSSVRTKINNDEYIGMETLNKICTYLNSPIEDIIKWERDIIIER